MSWRHGYYVGSTYTCNYFRELAPIWLDFAALVKGYLSPRSREGSPFKYVELGSGMGVGLCLLAATYPEGEFIGIDYMAEHIVHARRIAQKLQLQNIRFIEADLLEITESPDALAGFDEIPKESCHYVVAHGIMTWVSDAVQNAILQLATFALAPEGFFYASYNTYPGWLAMTSYQHLVGIELARCDASTPHIALEKAAHNLASLLGHAQKPTPLARATPFLASTLEVISKKNPAYLTQEYANLHWRPVYVYDLHERVRKSKLRYLASAALPDLFEQLLPEPARSTVLSEPNPTIRQTLLDLCTNRSFRRDIFSRGSVQQGDEQFLANAGQLKIRLQEVPPVDHYTFYSDFGQVSGDTHTYSQIETILENGPATLTDLARAINHPLPDVVQAVALLLHANRIGIDRTHSPSFSRAQENARRINAQLLADIQEGAPYAHLSAPAIGSGVEITRLESLLLEALAQGLEGDVLAACVQLGLQALNVELRGQDGQLLSTDAAQRQAILRAADAFATQRLPSLRSLGVVAA